MFDAWGKFPEGVLDGHINAFGDFDECLGIEVRNLQVLNTEYSSISRNFGARYCTTFAADYYTAMQPSQAQSFGTRDHSSIVKPQKAVSAVELLRKLMTQTVGSRLPMLPSIAMCMPNSCSQTDIQRFFSNVLSLVYNAINVDPTKMPYPFVALCSEKQKSDFSTGDISIM